MKHVLSLACIGSTMVLFATASCAQLPSTAAVVGAMRCPAYPDTQFLDPEKFDIETLTPGGCHDDAAADGTAGGDRTHFAAGALLQKGVSP
jgi:hypothetical protein